MSDQKENEAIKAVKLTQRLVELLSNENSDVRRKAIQAALTLLGDEPLEMLLPELSEPRIQASANDATDLGKFFTRGEERLKPSDNAQLCAAYHYAVHGPVGFSMAEIRSIASDAGVVIPDRPDKTFQQSTSKGKKLFQSAGKSAFKPTATAGLFFAEKWGIKPGKTPKTSAVKVE